MNPIIKCIALFLFCFALVSFLCWKLSGPDVVIEKEADHKIIKQNPYWPYKTRVIRIAGAGDQGVRKVREK